MSRNITALVRSKEKQHKGSLRNIKAHKITQQIQQLLTIDAHLLEPSSDKENVSDNLALSTSAIKEEHSGRSSL